MSTPVGFWLLPLLLSVMAAMLIGGALYSWGGRGGRSWAVPVAATIFFGGLGYAYDIPIWALIGGLFLAPVLFHRTISRRLEKIARRIETLELKDPDLILRRIPDYSGKYLGLWTSAPESPARHTTLLSSGDSSLVMALDFIGEGEDDYQVLVRSEAVRVLPGELIIYHREAAELFTQILRDAGEIRDIPDWPSSWVLKATPEHYALQLVDARTGEILRDIFELRTDQRELYIHIQGSSIRIAATSIYTPEELRRLLPCAAHFFIRVLERHRFGSGGV